MADSPPTDDRFAAPYPDARLSEQVGLFLRAVYGWMCTGLALTAITAWFVARTPALVIAIATNQLLFWAIVIAPFGLVFMLSARVAKMAPATASTMFMAYSVLTGVTMSVIL